MTAAPIDIVSDELKACGWDDVDVRLFVKAFLTGFTLGREPRLHDEATIRRAVGQFFPRRKS